MTTRPGFEDAITDLGPEGRRQLGRIAEDAPFGLYVDHPSRGCTYANPYLLELFGIEWPDFQGFGWARFVVAEDAERLQVAIRQFEHSREPIHVTYRVRHRDGAERWVNARVNAVVDRHGGRIGSIGLVRDVTEEREHRSRTRATQNLEAVGQLSARLAHDLNNLLTVMIGGAEVMVGEVRSPEGREHYDMLEIAFEQARQLTGQLLTLARGHVTGESACRLDAECERLERLLRSTLGERIQLELSLEAGDAHVALDDAQLGQVVVNLITNARDAIRAQGRVGLETRADDTTVMLRVWDDGAGMDEATRARIFDPFFTTKEPGRGTGLGLATLRDIVELAGGEVEVESRPGDGTRATIRLPRVGAVDYSPVRTELVGSLAGQGLVVLLVEDNEAIRQSLGYALALAGLSVLAAGSIAEALEVLEKGSAPDLVVSDVMLPDGLGTELVEQLRATRPDLPVVFMSGFASAAIEDLQREDPRARFLAKPFRSEDLLDTIRRLLGGTAPRAARPS